MKYARKAFLAAMMLVLAASIDATAGDVHTRFALTATFTPSVPFECQLCDRMDEGVNGYMPSFYSWRVGEYTFGASWNEMPFLLEGFSGRLGYVLPYAPSRSVMMDATCFLVSEYGHENSTDSWFCEKSDGSPLFLMERWGYLAL